MHQLNIACESGHIYHKHTLLFTSAAGNLSRSLLLVTTPCFSGPVWLLRAAFLDASAAPP